MTPPPPSVVEADLECLHRALEEGTLTSVELVARCLNRIGYYDRSGIALNSVPVLNPSVFADARASDQRRARGQAHGLMDGIPFTAKASFKVRGLPVTAGSPAFAELIADDDAFAVGQLRAAGAICLGLTNMPPMAAGGMQRGLYGRAESPYSAEYLSSAFGSGSSNGSGTATAASFAAFGLAEETWSSGRAPASNNSLVAYTPSRGVISVRGNWPLVPTMDVVVPHARCVDDLLHVLDVIVGDDPAREGDLWRVQEWIALPAASEVRPTSYHALPPLPLRGKRFAVPRMYINGDADNRYPIATRSSVITLWHSLCGDLRGAGAEVVETDFPVVENYERLHPTSRTMVDRGIVPADFGDYELGDLSIWAMDTFLRSIGRPALCRMADADPALIFPAPTGALPDRYGTFAFDHAYDLADYVPRARDGVSPWDSIPSIEAGMRGLEQVRRLDFEDWLVENQIDAVVFPAAADVAPSDADRNPDSADIAWRNGVWVSNGNLVPRHLGIPTVTIPMGVMSDTGMPVGVTLMGAAYSDATLLRLARSLEALRRRRVPPSRTPELAVERIFGEPRRAAGGEIDIEVTDVDVQHGADVMNVTFCVGVKSLGNCELKAFVNGVPVALEASAGRATGTVSVPADVWPIRHSEWRPPYGPLIVAVARNAEGAVAGALATTPGAPL
jgi:amidase